MHPKVFKRRGNGVGVIKKDTCGFGGEANVELMGFRLINGSGDIELRHHFGGWAKLLAELDAGGAVIITPILLEMFHVGFKSLKMPFGPLGLLGILLFLALFKNL